MLAAPDYDDLAEQPIPAASDSVVAAREVFVRAFDRLGMRASTSRCVRESQGSPVGSWLPIRGIRGERPRVSRGQVARSSSIVGYETGRVSRTGQGGRIGVGHRSGHGLAGMGGRGGLRNRLSRLRNPRAAGVEGLRAGWVATNTVGVQIPPPPPIGRP
jgi:hypothetical protein